MAAPTQGSLFGSRAPPASHRDDPDTSRQAEAAVTASGRRATNCSRVLALVQRHPGLTALQYHEGHCEAWGWKEQEVRRRLTDLSMRVPALVVRDEQAQRSPTVKAESRWWPVVGA